VPDHPAGAALHVRTKAQAGRADRKVDDIGEAVAPPTAGPRPRSMNRAGADAMAADQRGPLWWPALRLY
jgi:hypothetical protein